MNDQLVLLLIVTTGAVALGIVLGLGWTLSKVIDAVTRLVDTALESNTSNTRGDA